MYKAWKEASKQNYDFYLWLNDDTFLYSNALDSLLETSTYYDNKAIIVGATRSSDHSHVTYGGRTAEGMIPNPLAGMTEVDYFNGNVVLIPKSVYRVLGNLDPYFAHSKGDFDYGMRAGEAGIKMVQAEGYVGECDLHPHLDKWCDPTVPFQNRWQWLHRPNGMPPKETFHLEKRHYGLRKATFHYFTIYLRCLFPWVWVKLKHKS
jgi:GT2 family glycosyltransferase